jgi:hypothetical protein
MKKLIVLLALVLVPLVAGAEEGDALLIPDGTLYTIHYERSIESPEAKATSVTHLVLTARRGDAISPEVIPATLHGGAHFNPVIAYDAESGLLFAFWIHNPQGSATQLMFASRTAAGVWSEAASFGDYNDRRENLRIAVTRKFEDENGETRNGITVHLAWWQFTHETREKSAKYMMVTIQNGAVVNLEPLDLKQFVGKPKTEAQDDAQVDYRVLMQPILAASPTQDSVALLFGDLETTTLSSVKVRPVAKVGSNGRLRVPGGRRDAVPYLAPTLVLNEGDRIEGIYGSDASLALYTTSGGKFRYSLLRNGTWSQQHSIALDAQVTAGSAVDALRALVTDH